MTTSTPRAAPVSFPSGALRLTALAGLVGGIALVADTVTITVVNGSFGVLDGVLFYLGLVGLLATVVALSTALSTRRTGVRRAAVGLGVFVGTIAIIGALAELMDLMGHYVFSPANMGLHEEWFFFTVGVCLLLIAGWANRARA